MLEILNLDGETLYKRRFTAKFEDLDTSHIPHGSYFVKIQRKDCIETTRLFIS